MTIRPYTGNKDAVHAKPRAGTKLFVDYCVFLFGVKNLGIFADRNPLRISAQWRGCVRAGGCV